MYCAHDSRASTYTGPITRTVEDAAAALQTTAGHDPYDPRQTRDVPASIDVLGRLADGVSGLRIGVLKEGFNDADVEVRDLVMAAVDVLAEAGADVSKVSISEHRTVSAAQAALTSEGALAVFRTGFFGAFTRTYYTASLIAAVNKMWASQDDMRLYTVPVRRPIVSFSATCWDSRASMLEAVG